MIDYTLKVPISYCQEVKHDSCSHAVIEYNEEFHIDDQVRTLEFNRNNPIPCPDTSYAIWKILNINIENRKIGQRDEVNSVLMWTK